MVHFQYPALMGDAVAAFAFVANPGLATAAVAALDEEAVFAENAHHQSAHFQCPVLMENAAAVAAVFSPASGHDEDRRALFHFCQNHPT